MGLRSAADRHRAVKPAGSRQTEPTTTAATSSHEQHWSLRDCKRSSFACPSNVAGWKSKGAYPDPGYGQTSVGGNYPVHIQLIRIKLASLGADRYVVCDSL